MVNTILNEKNKSPIDIMPSIKQNKDVVAVSDKDKQIVKNILATLTTPYDAILYKKNYGTTAIISLWDNNDETTLNALKTSIQSELRKSSNYIVDKVDIRKEEAIAYVDILIKVDQQTFLKIATKLGSTGYVELGSIEKIVNEYIIN